MGEKKAKGGFEIAIVGEEIEEEEDMLKRGISGKYKESEEAIK